MNSLDLMLGELRLGTMMRHAQEVASRAEREGWSFTRYLHDLMEMELLERGQRRIQKRLKESGLPTGKTLTTLELSRLPEGSADSCPPSVRGTSLNGVTISSPLACQGGVKPICSAPSAMPSSSAATGSSLCPPSSWCNDCSRPNTSYA
jgi:IstB-like ATP binding protein